MMEKLRRKIFGKRQDNPSRPMTHEDRERISEEGMESSHTSSSEFFIEKGSRSMSYEKIPMLTIRTAGLGILASMGGFIFGYDTGQISGFIGMQNFKEYFGTGEGKHAHLTDARAGLIVSLLSIGTLIGALVAAAIADRIGRKWSLSLWCCVLFIGIIVQLTCPRKHWYQFMMGRFVAGLSVGALSLLVPLYMSEITPRHVRGGLVAAYQLFITLGIFTANCINYGTESRDGTSSWRIPLGITLIWGAILGFGILGFPESPRYDFRWGRESRAAKTLCSFYGVPRNHVQIQTELEEIEEKVKEDKDLQEEPWWRMFTYPTMPQRLFVGTALQGLQQLSGANYYFYYATTVFKGAGIKNDYVTQMILGGVNFGTTFLGLYFIERFGRRPSLFWGAVWMFVCFMVYSSVGHFALDRDNPEKTPGAGKTLVVFSCLFILGYASTWGPIIWAVIAELYPSRYRARAMAIPTAFNWMWNFLISFFTPFIVTAIDFRYGYVFTGCLGLSAFLIFFGVMETRGRTLEEIDTMYKLGVKPWRSAAFVVPRPTNEAREEFGRQQQRAEEESGGSAPASDNEAHIAPGLTPRRGDTDSAGQTPQSGNSAPNLASNENIPQVPGQDHDVMSDAPSQHEQHDPPTANQPAETPPRGGDLSPRQQT